MDDRIEITVDGEAYLCVRGRLASAPEGYERLSAAEQRRVLWSLASGSDAGRLARVAEIAMSSRPFGSELIDPEALASSLVDEIDRDHADFTVFREHRTPSAGMPATARDATALADLLPPATHEDTWHWIEIEIVDPDDAPVPSLRVTVELPDGQIRQLTTDHRGLLRVEHIRSAAQCTITFPALHGGTIEQL
jgi:hypothetical protein